MNAAVRVGLAAIAPIFAVYSLLAPPLSPSSSCQSPSTVATGFHYQAPTRSHTSAVLGNNEAGMEEREATGSPDLYGNEVIDAMATYELDDAGSLYEVHSPQTELPRLTSPTS
jgi:hypothetical protein